MKTVADLDFLETEIDWDDINSLVDLSDPHERKRREDTARCGMPITIVDGSVGGLREVKSRRCKNYDICERCAREKRERELRRLQLLIGMKYLEVNIEDEAKITRKYGKENIRRIPIGEDRTGFVIKTDDDIGQELDQDTCQQLAQHAIPENNRRISGNLGKPPSAPLPLEEEEENKEEKEVKEVKFTIDYREMDVRYDGDNDSPQNVKELEQIVRDEVEIYKEPETEDELQWSVYQLEEKAKEVCKRYNMSFNFLNKKQDVIKKSKINWYWVKKKQKKGQLHLI